MTKLRLTANVLASLLAVTASVASHVSADVLTIPARWEQSATSCPTETVDDDCSTTPGGERCLTKTSSQPAFDTACADELYHPAGK